MMGLPIPGRVSVVARPAVTLAGLVGAWWLATRLSGVPSYLLPDPQSVAVALWHQRTLLMWSTCTTLTETVLGLLIGTLLGTFCALAMVFSPVMARWLMPLLLLSQAIPVFALAPLLVLWFGFGMASKVVMAVLVIFFPVTAAFSDGLRRTDLGWLDLARTMNASPAAILRHVRLPAALPAFGSGLRVATAIAPIGAVVGEWVGASAGLGYVMLNANARIETDVMFAALFVLALMAILLWVLVDRVLKKLLYWAPDTTATI
jgi:putative hydroxymethylpyrimidine transport system permease protein